VCLTLALLAGFATGEPSRPHLSRAVLPVRGPLIEANDHPEWKQFLVQAAFRRADELERLRALPDTPMVVEMTTEPEVAPEPEAVNESSATTTGEEAIAALPPQDGPHVKDDVTGSIDEDKPTGIMPVEIGEASSVELPLAEEQTLPPVRQPETLQKLNDNQPKAQRKPVAQAKKKAPAKPEAQPATTDQLSTVFGEQASGSP
jgi:hypothetical protein